MAPVVLVKIAGPVNTTSLLNVIVLVVVAMVAPIKVVPPLLVVKLVNLFISPTAPKNEVDPVVFNVNVRVPFTLPLKAMFPEPALRMVFAVKVTSSLKIISPLLVVILAPMDVVPPALVVRLSKALGTPTIPVKTVVPVELMFTL